MPDQSTPDSPTAMLEQQTSRRRFLSDAGVTAIVAGVGSACKPARVSQKATAVEATAPTVAQAGDAASPARIRAAADAMDAMHEARMIVDCNKPGTWAFHCDILPHAESDHGMFGMVTALVVQP